MSDGNDQAPATPIDAVDWPEHLEARVVTPGPHPRLHGYDVEADLACHYRLSDAIYLAFTGELPAPGVDRAFEVCLLFLCPTSVAEGPTHAALATYHCGTPAVDALSVGVIGLGEQARGEVAAAGELLAWLDGGEGAPPPSGFAPKAAERPAGSGQSGEPPPASCLAREAAERAAVDRLRSLLEPTGLAVPALTHDLGRWPALVATLHACGVRRREHLEALLVVARLPLLGAEALARTTWDLSDYPLDLPRYRYHGRGEP